MAVFNSLGSNYNFRFALRALTPRFGHHHLRLKDYLEKKYEGEAILFHKGREALELALRIIQKIDNVPLGSGVVINGFTCFALYKAVVNAGYTPIYLDVEEGGLNFSPEKLKETLEANNDIKVVIVQNTLGYPCAIEEIAKLCQEKGILLIEDLAHSIGTVHLNNKEAGKFGDFIVFSFSQDKIIDAVSGGALIIRNTKYYIRAPYPLHNLGIKQQLIERFYPIFTWKIRTTYPVGLGKAIHALLVKLHLLSLPMGKLETGKFYRLPNWNCRLAQLQLNNLPATLTHRRKIAHIYASKIDPLFLSSRLTAQVDYSNNLRFPIFVEHRDGLISYLREEGVFISDIWYDAPISPRRLLRLTSYASGQCPIAEAIASKILNLPTHINVSLKKAERIADLINRWLQEQNLEIRI